MKKLIVAIALMGMLAGCPGMDPEARVVFDRMHARVDGFAVKCNDPNDPDMYNDPACRTGWIQMAIDCQKFVDIMDEGR